MSIIRAIIITFRPQQWIKNLILFAAYVFSLTSREISINQEISLISRVILAFIVFSFTSSAIYILNDILDARADSSHIRKKRRPIASGLISKPIAWLMFFVLITFSNISAFLLDKEFAYITLIYTSLFILYSIKLKELSIIDSMIIALGFVLRAVSGAIVIHVGISIWLIICTLFLALFLGFSKRRGELKYLGDRAHEHRKSLRGYNLALLDFILGICASLSIVSYSMYCLSGHSTKVVGADSLLTIPLVIVGIFRYFALVLSDSGKEDPTVALITDKPLLFSVIAWMTLWLYILLARPGWLQGLIIF